MIVPFVGAHGGTPAPPTDMVIGDTNNPNGMNEIIKRRSRVSMCAIGGCVSVCITLVSTKIRWCMLCMAAIMVVEPNRASTRGPLCMGVCTFVWCVCMGDSFNLCLQVWGKY